MSNDPYFGRTEVSNSDLSEMNKYWLPESVRFDIEKAYANGTLIDAMITEPHKVNYFKLTVEGEDYHYSADEFERAKEMKKAFMKDPFCQQMLKQCSFQKVTVKKNFPIEYNGFQFKLDMRCKWDLFCEGFDLSGDIKSTTATTQKQAEEAVRHFEYDRSRALYMDLEGRSNDMLIFISKINFKIFKIPVKRGGAIYTTGKEKYQELAFRWWYLFSDLKEAA